MNVDFSVKGPLQSISNGITTSNLISEMVQPIISIFSKGRKN